jgi:Secretion system C-terminal sorting domain
MLVYKNGLFYDGPYVSTAFTQRHLNYAAILCDKLQSGKDYSIKLTDLKFENGANTVVSANIHFKYSNGDIEDISLSLNETKKINFALYGKIDIAIELTYTDGSTSEFIQNVDIEKGISKRVSAYVNSLCIPQEYNFNTTSGIVIASTPFNGITGQAETFVYYRIANSVPNNPAASTCATNIARPLIMLDGIDDGSSRNHVGIYEGFLKYFDPAINDTIQIGDSLRRMGFDIIIFNPILHEFPIGSGTMIDGGDDFIQRNAWTLVQLIQNVNADLDAQAVASGLPRTEDIVIAGPSMGGQVSRLALTFMEQQFALTSNPVWQHHCRLWASLDSPHLGASIPVGIQELLKMLSFSGGAAAAMYNGNLRAPAAKQQLINQSDDSTNVIEAMLMDDSGPDRSAYITLMNAMGFPQNCRNIAIANGRSTGGYFYAPGSDMLDVKLGSTQYANLLFKTNFLCETNQTYTPLSIDFEHLNSIELDFTWKHDNLIPVLTWSVNAIFSTNNLYTNYLTNNSVYSNIETCPGSFYDVQQETADGISSGISTIFNGWPSFLPSSAAALNAWASGQVSFPVLKNNMAFISTVSSLALFNHNIDWSLPIPVDLVSNNLTPFDNYYVPTENEKHVSFTKASWRWLRQELLKGRRGADCIDPCIPYQLTGNQEPCINFNETYSIMPAIPANTYVNWSSNEHYYQMAGLPTATSNGISQISTSALYNQGWNYMHNLPTTIIASIENNCGANVELELPIMAYDNTYQIDEGFFDFNYNYNWCNYNITCSYYPNATYSWYDVDPNLGGLPTVTNTNLSPFGPFLLDATVREVWVQINSSCFGKSPMLYKKFFNPFDCDQREVDHDNDGWPDDDQSDGHDQDDDQHDDQHDDWGGPRLANTTGNNNVIISVTPNPAHIHWNVMLSGKIVGDVVYSVTDITGKLVLQGTEKLIRTKKFKITNEQLATGAYILSVQNNGKMFKYKLIKD